MPLYKPKLELALHPFAPDADIRFFYSFSLLEQALSVMRRLVQGKESVTLVIGERGSGKTIFMNIYMQTADENWRRCHIKARTLGPKGKNPPRKTLKKNQAFLCAGAEIPVVIIDDAHQMTKAELKSLFRDAYNPRNGNRSKRLVLFGDPSINARVTEIAETEGGHFSVNRIHIPRLSEEETLFYLNHRMSIAGYDGKPIFKSAAGRQIFRDSGGIPSDINRAARKWLKARYRFATTRLPRQTLFQRVRSLWFVLAALGIGILILVGLLTLRRATGIKTAAIKTRPGQVQAATKADTQPIQSRVNRKRVADQPSARADGLSLAGLKRDLPSRPLPVMGSPTPPGRVPSTGQPVQAEAWLLAQQSSSYTIQLIGVGTEKSLLAFIRGQDLPEHQSVAYYKTVYKGNNWYPLLYGVYPSARQARKAIESLPEPIQAMNPWIRRLSTIQKAIRRHAGPASPR